MDRKEIILNSWDATYDKEGWYPPLKIALEGVSLDQATWKPEKGSHSIRELVSHLLFYKDRFLHRLSNRQFVTSVQANHDTFFLGGKPSTEGWEAQVNELADVHRQIREKLHELSDADLDKPQPEEPVGAQALNLILHDAYHTGQILYIRKLQQAWPERRND